MSNDNAEQIRRRNSEIQSEFQSIIRSNSKSRIFGLVIGLVIFLISWAAGLGPLLGFAFAAPFYFYGLFFLGLETIGKYFALLAKNLGPAESNPGPAAQNESISTRSNLRIAEQLTRSQYFDWDKAGRPDLHAWERSGFPDFKTWLEKAE